MIREDIVLQLQLALAGIRAGAELTVDGQPYICQTDAGERVYRWRGKGLPPELAPALVLRDEEAPAEEEGAAIGHYNHSLQIHVGVLTLGGVADSTVRKMVQDVVKAVGAAGTMGGLADGVSYCGATLEAEHGSKVLMGALIEFEVRYSAPRWEL